MNLQRNIADFFGAEFSILYSQAFATISSVMAAFAKCGDIIVADQEINFAIQKGLQVSHSTICWFDHNDLKNQRMSSKLLKRNVANAADHSQGNSSSQRVSLRETALYLIYRNLWVTASRCAICDRSDWIFSPHRSSWNTNTSIALSSARVSPLAPLVQTQNKYHDDDDSDDNTTTMMTTTTTIQQQ